MLRVRQLLTPESAESLKSPRGILTHNSGTNKWADTLCLFGLHHDVLVAPAVERLLGNSHFPARQRVRLVICACYFNLRKYVHDLLRAMLLRLPYPVLLPFQFALSPPVQNLPGIPRQRGCWNWPRRVR